WGWCRRRAARRLIVDRIVEYVGKSAGVISQLGIDGLGSEASRQGERGRPLIRNKGSARKERVLRDSHFGHIGIVVVVDGQRDILRIRALGAAVYLQRSRRGIAAAEESIQAAPVQHRKYITAGNRRRAE